MQRILVVGAGGFGRELMLYVRELPQHGVDFEVAGFLDDNPAALAGIDEPAAIIGRIEVHEPRPDERFVIGVGDPGLRQRIAGGLSARGAQFLTVVHPRAWIAPNVQLGAGCILGPFTFVGPGATLEEHVMLNCFASVGHDSLVKRCSVLSPYAVINGAVTLGEQVFLGTHATVTAGKIVGSFSKVSAGSVAMRNVPEGSLVSGNPGKSRVMFRNSPDQ